MSESLVADLLANLDFDVTESEALQIQRNLRAKLVVYDDEANSTPLGATPRPSMVAGVDVAYIPETDTAVGGVAVFDTDQDQLSVVAQETAVVQSKFDYRPGLLSFRELPAVLAALSRLDIVPGLIICDGHGVAHPARFGLASHLGVLLDVPTIGVAKKPLFGEMEEPGPNRGDRSPISHDGELLGYCLRTQDGVKPVYVSPGHLLSAGAAADLVLRLAPNYRLPETTRAADSLVNSRRRTLLT